MATEAQTGVGAPQEPHERTAGEHVPAPPAKPASRRPILALAGVVGLAFTAYTILALAVDVPRVHPDEVRYLIAGSSLVEGEGMTLRGEEYGFGPLYALVIAAILLFTGSPDAGYDLFKAANALFFALTAIPVFLLARRLVSDWWAVLAAALSVAIPSSVSVATVMTESLAFLAAATAFYATALALERPTIVRQLLLLAAIAAAFLTRAQLGALYLTWLLALGLMWLLVPRSRPRSRADLVRYWPSAAPLALAVAVLGSRLLSGDSVSDSLGAYWELWRGYDPLEVAKWVVYHLADLEIYLAVVPLAVAPIVLASLLRQGRSGDDRAAAAVSLFLAANAVGLLVVAAFTSTPWGYDRLHDRYAFYLFPLWLILFVRWLAGGLPRPLVATASGVVLALVLPAVLPFRQLANEAGIDTVPGALWVRLETELPGSARVLLGLFVVGLAAAAVLVPRRYRLVLPAAVLAVLLITAVPAWDRMIGAPEDAAFAGGLERAWIDERLDADARVTKLYLESEACPASALTRHSLFLTEFFNETVDRAAYVDDSVPDGIPVERVNVGAGGVLELSPGNPLEADYVYTQPGIELDGRQVATGTAANLVLWRTGGPVRVVGARSNADVRTADCA